MIRFSGTTFVAALLLACVFTVEALNAADTTLLLRDFYSPPAVEWNTVKVRDGNNPLAAIPDWVINGTHRSSPERRPFTTWNYLKKGQRLLPSGWLGAVMISATSEAVTNK